MENNKLETLIRVSDAAEKFGVHYKTIWSWTNPNNSRYKKDFPKPIRISGRATAFRESDLIAYQQKMINQPTN